ncbi:MAG: cytochrome c oxidase subunit II [Candidatus Acidiferrales bacterium]
MTGLIPSNLQSVAVVAALIPLRPTAASSIAEGVDHLYFFLTVITLFFTILIFGTIFFFMIKYRRRSPDEIPPDTKEHLGLELTWTIIPTLITVFIFVWASSLYFENSRPPEAATEIFVVGKQWMWHIQHPEGVREINELHVPVNVPISITLTSDDVIHDFYIPAFRVKKDAVPGRYTSLWFQATKIGTYHIFCGQYCGADHAEMIGWVYVMSDSDYAAWLSGGSKNESMAQTGERLFTQLGCVTCHVAEGTGRGPSLVGLYGKPEKLRSGDMKVVDETLIRQAIVNPNSILLPNYPPIMPTFQGQINEEQVLQLIAYVKSLGAEERKTNAK